jgi:hypothetical protein
MRRKIHLPPPGITSRIDGWVGQPDDIPASIAAVIALAMPQPNEIDIIRARMLARQKKVLGDD